MAKLLMLYASGTGNTELMAEAMVAYLEDKNHEVVTKTFDFDPIDVEELLEYDAILIGTHTWDDGDLPYEVEDFYEEIDDVNITGKLFGVFGSADSFYDTYGGAVNLMADRLSKAGAVLVPEQLKVDLEPDRVDIERCEQMADTVLVMIDEKMKGNVYL
ncbi:flavodoxin I [Virgibacillus natechei]|uniref:Flavodoxin I n=1 Tax=Virgibacillus natechei TaxID=1216297 RepID=A0ABS4IHV8_9BACI|nr:flavodoxin domain-containing protein [Virgibacillus natechei]MBP1969906.1 flavodoxin I [Virgibacillus natechei]UZD13429.1 flavodoxin domain-containing protein [Virgibacillus natechei]